MTDRASPAVCVRNVWREFPPDVSRRTLFRVLREIGQPHARAQRRVALRDVSLTVGGGEKVAIIGNNGAGKSTLLKIVAGLLRPTRGSVTIQGDMVLLTSLGVGMIEEVSVVENTLLYGSLYGVDPARMKAAVPDILAWAEITGHEHARLRTLSTGTRARLAFSVVRHIATDVFLIDEALAAGDVTFRARCRAFFDEPVNHRRTFLVATHDMDFATSFCAKALWLHHGSVQAFGASAAVVEQYLAAGAPGPGKVARQRASGSGS